MQVGTQPVFELTLNLHGLLFWADEAQKQIVRVSDIPQPPILGIIRVTRGESSALLDEPFDFGSMPFLILQSPEAVADALVGLHKDSRKNGHSLSECCHGVVFGLCQLRGHRIGCSRLRQQHSASKYRYRMGSWPTARIRRALGRIIPPKTARIICESMSIQGLWPLLQESLCNPRRASGLS